MLFLDEHHQCPCRASHLPQFVGELAHGRGEQPQCVGHIGLHLGAQTCHKVYAVAADPVAHVPQQQVERLLSFLVQRIFHRHHFFNF